MDVNPHKHHYDTCRQYTACVETIDKHNFSGYIALNFSYLH
jgi:hypothetical protein